MNGSRFHFARRSKILCAAVALALTFAPESVRASDTDLDPGHGAIAPIRLLTFLKNAPLTDDERVRIMSAAHGYEAQHSAEYQQFSDSINKLLDDIATKPAPIQASRREALRVNVEKRPADDLLRQIVDRVDPVVASDTENKALVTRATLIGWDRQNQKLAHIAGVAAPENFVAAESQQISATFEKLSSREQSALAAADRDLSLVTYVYTAEIKPSDRPKAVAEARPYISSPDKFGLPLATKSQDYFESYVNRTMFNQMFFTQVLMHVDENRNATARQIKQDNESHQGIGLYPNGTIGPYIK